MKTFAWMVVGMVTGALTGALTSMLSGSDASSASTWLSAAAAPPPDVQAEPELAQA